MDTLTPDECRALGTLVEKALTTPAQYPLSLNSLVTGINQRSNRDPVVEFDEERTLRAVDGLRAKGLLRDVSFTGGRVEKYRHLLGEALELRPPELAVVCELLVRGPQTVGELRARGSRMHPFESIEVVEAVLSALATREAPLVRELPPLPGSRAARWMQLFCEHLHPIGSIVVPAEPPAMVLAPTASSAIGALEEKVAGLEERIRSLEETVAQLRVVLS